MVAEYIGSLGEGLRDMWHEQLLPLWQGLHDSPVFWVGLVVAGVAAVFFFRHLSR